MHRSVVVDNKPKMLLRNPNEILITWDNVYKPSSDSKYHLQMLNELKEWKTIYRGKKNRFKVDKLAPCTCYCFRIKLDNEDKWVHFKAATEDIGPYNFVMHMSRAVKLGKFPLIRKIANTRPHLLETENKENKTPLIQAIETGDGHLVHLLITLGANVNTSLSYNQRTALMIAVYKGFLQIASVLIDKGADVHAKDVNGLNVLHYAVDSNNVENVKFCMQHFTDLDSVDNNGWTPLIRAAILKISPNIHNTLIQSGANQEITDKNGFDYNNHRQI